MRNRFAFAVSTNSPGALDLRLKPDIERYGIGAFTFEVIEAFTPEPEMTRARLADELKALEAIYRDELEAVLHY